MKIFRFSVFLFCLLLFQIAFGQKKVAILICGADTDNLQSNGAFWNNNTSYAYEEEFYYDTFLMWKMLKRNGFSEENMVLHGISWNDT